MVIKRKLLLSLSLLLPLMVFAQDSQRARDLGIQIGVMQPGTWNAITDVKGVLVGHQTMIRGDSVRTGATVILPYSGNIFQDKVPAAIFIGNGFGKLAGISQVAELGTLETPIVLTNTMSVPVAMDALVGYTISQSGNEHIQSVNAVVGETNDGFLNDIRGRHLNQADVMKALKSADSGKVQEGSVGAGTGTVCFGYKGGIGTSSRKLPESLGGYTVGVLVQSNFGGVLQIDGVPIGKELRDFNFSDKLLNNVDGSCMIVLATDAPLDARNLERLSKRAFMGLAKTGGIASNGSGDYVISFSTSPGLRVPHDSKSQLQNVQLLHNDMMSPLFMAAIEATEEAIINSLFAAKEMSGFKGNAVSAIPKEKIIEILKKYKRL